MAGGWEEESRPWCWAEGFVTLGVCLGWQEGDLQPPVQGVRIRVKS